MKKFSIGLILMLALLLSMTVGAFAAEDVDYDEEVGWTVEWNGKDLKSTSDDGTLSDTVSEMQPGDSILFKVTIKSTSDKKTNWYMNNEVLKSFEDNGKATDGAYTYILKYNGDVIYSNEAVGGDVKDDGKGLYEADGSLKDDFLLDTLSKGQTGEVTLYVALDGETQGNIYQNAIAQLKLQFGVEEEGEPVIIHTGDTTNTLPFFIAAGVSGIALIVVVVIFARRSKNNRRGGARA